jgi:single-strand DNA-binding protein
MANSLNKVTLIGNLGNAPEVRKSADGKKIVTFSVATSRNWVDKVTGEKKGETQWHKVVVFNEALANVIETYAKKGSKVYLEGNLQTRKWQDQTTNQDRYTTEVVLNFGATFILLDNKNSNDTVSENNSSSNSNVFIDDEVDDEIPF